MSDTKTELDTLRDSVLTKVQTKLQDLKQAS